MKKILFFLTMVCSMLFADIKEVQISKDAVETSDAKLIDVRSPEEYKETGVVPNAILIPLFKTNGDINENFLQDIQKAGINKYDKVFLMCRSGSRSKMAAKMLEKDGYKDITNLTGGVNSLIEQNYPLVKRD